MSRWLAAQLAGAAVGAAECRAAGTGGWPDALSARRRRTWRVGWSASSSEDGVNLIGGCCGTNSAAHRRAGCDAAPARRRIAARRRSLRKPVWMPCGRQPVPGGAVAAGECVLRHRRALQRQRLEEVARGAGEARLGRLRLDGPRADRRRFQRARCLHRVRRPRRDWPR